MCNIKTIGHVPYFIHMIRLWKDEKIEEQTFMHYDNSENVNLDTFNYIMNIVKNQCDHYYNRKINNDKKLMNAYTTPLTLCGVNSANYDLYFFINLLMKSEYSKRFVSKTIFKGNTLIFLC